MTTANQADSSPINHSANQPNTNTLKAGVVVRTNSGGANYIYPGRVYLFVAVNGIPPKSFNKINDYLTRTYFEDNLRATKRISTLVAIGEQAAAAYNAKDISWTDAKIKFTDGVKEARLIAREAESKRFAGR